MSLALYVDNRILLLYEISQKISIDFCKIILLYTSQENPFTLIEKTFILKERNSSDWRAIMAIKSIVMDIDGTLLTSEKKISPKTRQALVAAQKKAYH